MIYFSDRENGEQLRNHETIEDGAWGGIQAVLRGLIENGSFGAEYPATCPDGACIIGTDDQRMAQVIRAEIPVFVDPPWQETAIQSYALWHDKPGAVRPSTQDILDLIEFCWRAVGKPIQGHFHSYFGHHHLSLDIDAGRQKFREDINRILARNGLVYELRENGKIERLGPPVLGTALISATFRTGDMELDELLEKARRKTLDPHIEVRKEALEALWDAWERLKTLQTTDKKAGTAMMLDKAAGASSPVLRAAMELDARELSGLGNNLRIRHSETGKESISESRKIDYLFYRLFNMITVILRAEEL